MTQSDAWWAEQNDLAVQDTYRPKPKEPDDPRRDGMTEMTKIAPQHLLDQDLLHSTGVHRGLNWAIGRGAWGLNGYVQIPEDHPWRDLMEVGDFGENLEVTVHGGLTFAHDGWIGFDTAHYGDVWEAATPASITRLYAGEDVILWTEEMLRDEVLRLADQVADNA